MPPHGNQPQRPDRDAAAAATEMAMPEFLIARVDEIAGQPAAVGRRSLEELCAGHIQHIDAIRAFVVKRYPDRPDLLPTLQAEDAPRKEPAVPDQVGPYKVLERIGEGGMGAVFLAEQVELLHRRVALKLIREDLETREVIGRFEVERQALALMNHANIARVYDAGTTQDGRPFFAMEYVPGLPITEYCDAHRLTVEERIDLLIEVCGALQHAHEKGVIHRDVKPSNVLVMRLDGAAVPKIIDFGVAKATNLRLTQKTLFTQRGLVVGTPEYMSPEQAMPSKFGVDLDARTDVYSLGVLMYELLVGCLPFDDQDNDPGLLEIQRRIRDEQPIRPSSRFQGLESDSHYTAHQRRSTARALTRTLRGPLDWIVLRGLEKDPDRRYPSAASFANDLARFRHAEAVKAGPPSVAYRLSAFAARHRGRILATASAVAVVAAIGWWTITQQSEIARLRAALRGDASADGEMQLSEALRGCLTRDEATLRAVPAMSAPERRSALAAIQARRPMYASRRDQMQSALDDPHRGLSGEGRQRRRDEVERIDGFLDAFDRERGR